MKYIVSQLSQRASIAVWAAMLLLSNSCCFGQQPDIEKRARLAVDNVMVSREELLCGVATIDYRKMTKVAGKIKTEKLNCVLAFDYLKSQFSLKELSEKNHARCIISGGGQYASFGGQKGGCIDIFSSDEGHRVPDARSLALVPFTNWKSNDSFKSYFLDRMKLLTITDVTEGEVCEIIAINPAGKLLIRTRPGNGHALEEVTLTLSSGDFKGKALTYVIQWKLINDIWLPIRRESTRPENGEREILDIVWSNVNKPELAKEVCYDDLDPYPGTTIVEHRLGPHPVIIGKWGVNEEIPPFPTGISNTAILGKRGLLFAVAVIAICVSGCLLGYWIRRRAVQ
jgi:hypothetical protein